ncbi:MAG: PilZ domain-containing protein [Proteobacteria bacterium]|nr:MAG: PilZ domain-containing protein [Pseudomonadota bacterium]
MVKKKEIDERRRAQRTEVRDSFNLFLVVPELSGMARIYLRDISAVGLCFLSELDFKVTAGQVFQARIYLSPAFYLPLECKVVRISGGEIAVDFTNSEAGPVKAIAKLQEFFEAAEESGVSV